MRATLRHVARHPSWLPDWWLELPWRRRPLRKLRVLLTEPGRGWLRWGMKDDLAGGSYIEPPEPATWVPPLRQLWLVVSAPLVWLLHGGGWYRDDYPWDDGKAHWYRVPLRRHLCSWSELRRLCTDPEWPWGYLP